MLPATNVKVSVALSATTSLCPETAIVLNASEAPPPPPPAATPPTVEPSEIFMEVPLGSKNNSPSSPTKVVGSEPPSFSTRTLYVVLVDYDIVL